MRTVLLALVLGLLCSGTRAAVSQETSHQKPQTVPPIDAVMRDLCGKTVVSLGEPPVHGFGRVLDFKVELVRRLISECHFNGFFIESGIYDFLKIQERLDSKEPITAAMVRTAIGGLWANDETERLIPYLLQGVQSRRLTLAGLDDQLSRGSYAQYEMPADLVQYLSANEKQDCLTILKRHTLWQYSDDSPYGAKDYARIVGCLGHIEAAASRVHTKNSERELQMVVNFKRTMARDFPPTPTKDTNAQIANERDRSMYQNFEWLRTRMPPGSKIIVWTATTHAAKDLSGVPGNERVSMGSFIHRDLGQRAFTLGFSEYSGSYAFGRQPAHALAPGPKDSLEAMAFNGNGLTIRYFGWNDLQKIGPIAARPLGIEFKTAKWDDVLDGLIVFREEHPPTVSSKSSGE